MALTLDLTAKKALVTGVTSGIGMAIATMLSRAGCDVAGCGHRSANSAGAMEFQRHVNDCGQRADYRVVDLAKPEAARTWVDQAAAALGGCDLLVSNAGRNIFEGVSACTEAAWNECMNLDLAAHWRVAQAARSWLERAAPGVVIIISSNHAYATLPNCFPYNVAKAGLTALVQSLALEWGPTIRAVGIAPGFIDTAGNDQWFASFPDPVEERRRTEALHPVGRIGQPEEIGALCAYLATPWAGFISGTTLLVDGGRHARLQDD
jgi:NAD(P)-dependent dehydrogenase (short-subunit alcohol dehydrogenase family)